MYISANALAAWVGRLVQIASVTPLQAHGDEQIAGEGRLAAALARVFADLGAEVTIDEVAPGRPNVYGVWRGQGQRWLALDVHTDTVGVANMLGDPFSGRVADGRVWGRGSVDTKASLGVGLALLEALHARGLRPAENLLIAAIVDEEGTALGAPAFARWVRAQGLALDELLVAEPTCCAPAHGHKGVCRVAFEVQGSPAHSSRPELGANAIAAAAELVRALGGEHARLQALPPAGLGSPTLTVATIQGGAGLNIVPERCTVGIDRRLVEDETTGEVAQTLESLARAACPLPLAMRVLKETAPFWQPRDSPFVQRLADWSGQAPTLLPFSTDAWAYGDLAAGCAVLGPGSIEQAHGREEWVAIAQLETLAALYTRWWGIG